MIYRTTAVFIVLFWLTMTGLLVHQEIRPADSALREIPVSHVVKLFFMHRQESNQPQTLNIWGPDSSKLPIGMLKLDPKIDEQTQNHNLNFAGEIHISSNMLGGKRQHIAWEGELEMDKFLTTHRFRLAVKTHIPFERTDELVILPEKNTAHYELRAASGVLESNDYPLDERGVQTVLQQFDLDPSMFAPSMFPVSSKQLAASAPVIKSRLSTMMVNGENIDTYLTTIEYNGQTLLECQVDQLGNIARLSSPILDYTLAPPESAP